MKLQTLQRTGNQLSSPKFQLKVLGDSEHVGNINSFEKTIHKYVTGSLRSLGLTTLQINLGKVCNQTCSHCHVDAGPDRRESMSRETAEDVIDFLRRSKLETLDITGGAPEMNPNFVWLVEQASEMGLKVIDRCNLTILLAPGFTQLPEFLARHRVEVVASLPCYLEDNCDAQRGSGVFAKSIQAIKRLNDLGYGDDSSGLSLNLVYNPVGTGLPPNQNDLEQAYRDQLGNRYAIRFSHLYTITNMPISRYLDDLLRRGELSTYMEKLVRHFNPQTLSGLMCRTLVSVDWQGNVYDCDFNQMLDLPIQGAQTHISKLTEFDLANRMIKTANHCFGCTAGSGSSCTGTID
ncbi:MAG TPA: radical SAM protein [Planctomycetaceae bacterium]|nr:radical SAM protein [Planctomycetaceae bacterium]